MELPIQVAGVDGIPAAGGSSPPVAVIAHVTAVSGTSFTSSTLYPADSPYTPNTSDLNVDAQQNTPNLTIVQLAQTGAHVGAVDLYNSLGSINAIATSPAGSSDPPSVAPLAPPAAANRRARHAPTSRDLLDGIRSVSGSGQATCGPRNASRSRSSSPHRTLKRR